MGIFNQFYLKKLHFQVIISPRLAYQVQGLEMVDPAEKLV